MNPRQFAIHVVSKLQQAGYQALWAGGCVRDQLLGIEPKDYDVATSATPDQVRSLFGHRKTLPIGAAFGVISVLGPNQAGSVEVATFRTDEKYSDGRHPDAVIFSTPQEDAQRRDFTINGIFFDPIKQQVIDYVGGQQDLKNRVVRAIGNPLHRIHEDKLRMLRGVRFAATFDFALDPATQAAITEQAAHIQDISAERIGMEIVRILSSPQRARGVALLLETGLLQHLLPTGWQSHFNQLSDQAQEVQDKLQRLVTDRCEPGFYLLFQPLLNYFCQQQLSAPHVSPVPIDSQTVTPSVDWVVESIAEQRAQLAQWGGVLSQRVGELQQQFRLTNQRRDEIVWIANAWPILAQADRLPWALVQPFLVHPSCELGLAVADACQPANRGVGWSREQLKQSMASLNPPPLISGEDLISLGFRPGPNFKSLLQEIRDRQLEGQLKSAEQAQAWLGCQ